MLQITTKDIAEKIPAVESNFSITQYIYVSDWRPTVVGPKRLAYSGNSAELVFQAYYNPNEKSFMRDRLSSGEADELFDVRLEIMHTMWNGLNRPLLQVGNMPSIVIPTELTTVEMTTPICDNSSLYINGNHVEKISAIGIDFRNKDLHFTLEANSTLYNMSDETFTPYTVAIDEELPCQVTIKVTDITEIFPNETHDFIEQEMREYFSAFHDVSHYTLAEVIWTNEKKDATLVATRISKLNVR